jgi:hypothetical protein
MYSVKKFISSVVKKASILMLVLTLSFVSIASANNGGKSEKDKKLTFIELTKEEAQQFEVNNGGLMDENIAGGTIVLDGELSDAQKKKYKEELLKQKKPKKQQSGDSGDIEPQWCTGYYLKNVQYLGNTFYFPSQRLGSSEGWGPITLSVQVQTSVSATFSSNVSVSADVVSAGVGYSVTASYSVSSSGTWTVPDGNYGRLEAYALYDKHSWEVWDDDCGTPEDSHVGNGNSWKPNNGVYFKKVIVK